MANMNRYAEIQEKIRALQAEAKAAAQDAFNTAAKEIFAAVPALENFSWRQYTRYWNDGEPCYFYAHTDGFFVNGERADDYSWDEIINDDDPEFEDLKGVAPAVDMISALLGAFDNDAYLMMFGDHAEVYVTPNGITVEEYANHD